MAAMSDKKLISPLFIRCLPVAVLDSMGFKFVATSINKSDVDYALFVTVMIDGKPAHPRPVPFGTQKVGGVLEVSQESVFDHAELKKLPTDGNRIVIIHTVPWEYRERCREYSGRAEVSLSEIMKHDHGGADNYVDYLSSEGVPLMSVGYNGLPMNLADPRKLSSSIMQGAKAILSADHKTYMLMMNYSIEPGYDAVAKVRIELHDRAGRRVSVASGEIPAFQFRLLELGADLPHAKDPEFYNILGASTDTTLLPFVIVHNARKGSCFIEHGVVPRNYVNSLTGQAKMKAARMIEEGLC